MKNRTQEFKNADFVNFTAGASPVLSFNGADGVVRLPSGRFGLAYDAVAANAAGTLAVSGRFLFAKATGVVLAQGDLIGWDVANRRVTTDLTLGLIGRVTVAALTAQTEVEADLNPVDPGVRTWTNRTGGDVAAGVVVRDGGTFLVVINAVANNATGIARSEGEALITKPTGAGTDYAANIALGWDDANSRVTTSVNLGAIGRVVTVPATADTTVRVRLNPEPRVAQLDLTATAHGVSGNSGTWVIGFTPTTFEFLIFLVGGGLNLTGFTSVRTAGTVTFQATSITGTDRLVGRASEFPRG